MSQSRGIVSRIVLSLIICFFASGVFAAKPHGNLPPAIAKKINHMQVFLILANLNSGDITQDTHIAQLLAVHPFEEVVLEFIKRLHYDLQIRNNAFSEADFMLVESLLEVVVGNSSTNLSPELLNIKYTGIAKNPKNQAVLEALHELSIEFATNDYHKQMPYYQYILNGLLVGKRGYQESDTALTNLKELLDERKDLSAEDKIFRSSIPDINRSYIKDLEPLFNENRYLHQYTLDGQREHVQEMREFLESNVIEQPDVIEHLIEIEINKSIHQKDSPHIFATIGMPGTGKDTIAENYIKAQHPDDVDAVNKYLYRFKIAKGTSELWAELGATAGIISSDTEAAFIKFAVSVSGGRYMYVPVEGGRGFKVIENPHWKGKPLPGFMTPEKALVFINEFHNWSGAPADDFLKQYLEKGIIPINNPNGGLKEMFVNIPVQIASNDAIELVADRYADGRPRGKSQNYEELMKRWEGVRSNIRLLKSFMMKGSRTGGGSVTPSGEPGGGGTKKSEEVLNRVNNIFLLQPISPKGIQQISEIHLNQLKTQYLDMKVSKAKLNLSWTPEMVQFLQEYQYNAEDMGRPVKNKVERVIQSTIDKAIFYDKIKVNADSIDIEVDIVDKQDGTYSLKTIISDKLNGNYELELPIRYTEITKFREPISDERMDELLKLPDEIKSKVVGQDAIVTKFVDTVIATEIDRNINHEREGEVLPPATVMGFFGLSSTGKTELAKVLAEKLKAHVWTVEGNHMQTEKSWEETFGIENESPDFRSKFMKEYDKSNGRLIIILDEFTNIQDKSLLQKLYPYAREEMVAGRKMANVTIVVTGNTGQEIFQGIPQEVPERERFYAEQMIYKNFINNEALQFQMLLRDYPEALVKRMGIERALFFAPHNHVSVKQLLQIKLKQALDTLFTEHKERPWWDVKFKDKENFNEFLHKMADEGYRSSGQGDSINRLANISFGKNLKTLLAKNKVSVGSEVIISLDVDQTKSHAKDKVSESGEHTKGVYIKVDVPEEDRSLELFIKGKPYDRPLKSPKVELVKTAYHEAGHAINTLTYKSDVETLNKISRIPGVTQIGGEYIYYAGVAVSDIDLSIRYTRESLVREVAVLLGGYVAESLVTKDGRHTEGKHNDIERASEMIRHAILSFGLAEEFGLFSKPADQTISEYEKTIRSDAERSKVYTQEVQKILSEGEQLAKEAILINWSLFKELGYDLAVKVELNKKQLKTIVNKHKDTYLTEESEEYMQRQLKIRNNNYERNSDGSIRYFSTLDKLNQAVRSMASKVKSKLTPSKGTKVTRDELKSRKIEMLHPSLMPKRIGEVDKIINKRVEKQRKDVAIYDYIPLAKKADAIQQENGRIDNLFDYSKGAPNDMMKLKSCASYF